MRSDDHLRRDCAFLAELERYPIGLMISGALVFDHHTHLRHDMAPALGRPVPATDADRMRAGLTWMTAVLSNQVAHAPVDGLDARIALTLTGPGGGTWWIDEAGVLTPSDGKVAAQEESRGSGLRVLAVCPGAMDTEFFDAAGSQTADYGAKRLTPEAVVKTALATLDRRSAPPSVITNGRPLALATKLLPRRQVVQIMGRMARR